MTHKTDIKENQSFWSRNFILLFLSNFFLFFGADMLSPVLPVYIQQHGGNSAQIGIVMGGFTISAIIIRLFAVQITEYLGHRLFLLCGLFICAIAASGYYFTSLIMAIFLIRVFHGIGFGAATTLYGALASNMIPKTRMGEGMGFFGLGTSIAIAVGPFLGAIAAEFPNYQFIFLVSSGLILLSMVLTKISGAGTGEECKGKRKFRKISISDFLEPKAVFPSALGLVLGISVSGIFTFIVLFALEAKIENVGLFFLINAMMEFIIRPGAGKLFDKKGTFVIMVPGAIISAISVILLSMTVNLPMLILSAILNGIGVGMLFPTLNAWSLKSVEPERRVAANVTFYNLFDVGIAIGSVLLGSIAQVTGYANMFLYSSLIFGVFLIVYLIHHYRATAAVK